MTFAEIAAELGVDERTARRIVDTVLAKLRSGLGDAATPELVVRTLMHVLAEREQNYSSSEDPTISGVPRRFSPDLRSVGSHADRVVGRSAQPSTPSPGSGVAERRDRHALPRRFSRKP